MCPDVRPEWPGITYLKINKYINIAISNSYLSRASTAGGDLRNLAYGKLFISLICWLTN